MDAVARGTAVASTDSLLRSDHIPTLIARLHSSWLALPYCVNCGEGCFCCWTGSVGLCLFCAEGLVCGIGLLTPPSPLGSFLLLELSIIGQSLSCVLNTNALS